MKKVMIKIANELNKFNITWAFGGSLTLQHHNIIAKANDIDLMIKLEDIDEVDKILKKLGSRIENNQKSNYKTTFFSEYMIDGVDVDVMAEFKIENDIIYTYRFSEDSITSTEEIDKTTLYYASLEEWFILYYLMNRTEKITMLQAHFNSTGKINPILLKKSLEDLSAKQKHSILTLLKKDI